MPQVAAPLQAEKNNKRIKAVRPPLSSTPSTIDVLPEGSGEEGGGRFERDGRCRDKGIQLFRAVAKRCCLGRAQGNSANLSPRLGSRVPRWRQLSSRMGLITGWRDLQRRLNVSKLRMKQDNCDYRGKSPGRMHVRR